MRRDAADLPRRLILAVWLTLLTNGGIAFAAEPIDANTPSDSSAQTSGRLPGAVPLGRLDPWMAQLQESAADDHRARYEATLRLAEATRDLGLLSEARNYAYQALAIAHNALTATHESAALGVVASVQRSMGNLEVARVSLDRASTLAQVSNDRALRAALIHERALLERRTSDLTNARKHFEEAIQLMLEDSSRSSAFQSAVELARLEKDAEDSQDASLAIDRAFSLGETLESDPSATATWIALARIAQSAAASRDGSVATALRARALESVQNAVDTARRLDDARNLAWSLGTQAGLLRETSGDTTALKLAQESVRHARRARDYEAELRFTALVGRLQMALGNAPDARRNLERAVELWRDRRASVVVDSSEIREFGHALLFDLVDLLTREARTAPDPDGKRQESQALLSLAQDTLESLRAAELRDYFDDDCVDAYRERSKTAAELSLDAAIIYPIAFSDRLEILVSNGPEIRQFTVDVDARKLSETAHSLRRRLPDRSLHAYKLPAKDLYDWLIRPIKAYLAERSIQTLVFVPGGALRLIPMASLYDGETFLVESFAIATIPALELIDSGPIGSSRNHAFLGGLAQGQGEFGALPHVPRELNGIRSTLGRGKVVLDEKFKKREIEKMLAATEFNIVHIATHAQFGTTSDDTYLLAYDGRIKMDELADWVGAFRYRETPLNLIVLSACESAAGDERAALGLSGIAIKAGAQSALGTLWSVNDNATANLIDTFYHGLIVDDLSRAEALRRAQLELLEDPNFRHPYYWAPFLLINAWL